MAGKSRAELKTLTPAILEDLVDGLEPASKHAAVLCVDGVKKLVGERPRIVQTQVTG
jgi:hypothetical protein